MINAQGMQFVQLITPVSGTAVASAIQDLRGAAYATIVVNSSAKPGSAATSTPTLQLLYSDNSSSFSTSNTVTATRTEANTSAHMVVYHVDNRALGGQFVKLTITPGTHTTNDVMVLAATAVLARLQDRPDGTTGGATGMVGSTNDACIIV